MMIRIVFDRIVPITRASSSPFETEFMATPMISPEDARVVDEANENRHDDVKRYPDLRRPDLDEDERERAGVPRRSRPHTDAGCLMHGRRDMRIGAAIKPKVRPISIAATEISGDIAAPGRR
jgi:hypothetical protein